MQHVAPAAAIACSGCETAAAIRGASSAPRNGAPVGLTPAPVDLGHHANPGHRRADRAETMPTATRRI